MDRVPLETGILKIGQIRQKRQREFLNTKEISTKSA